MSKIFTALKKAQGELASIAGPLIELAEAGGNGRRNDGAELPSDSSETAPSRTTGPVAPESPREIRRAPLLKSEGRTDDRFSAFVGGASQNIEKALELRQIPVEQVRIEAASRVVLHTDPRSPGADRFRYLRLRLNELRDSANLRSLVVTSALPRDGKSTCSINLATVLAEGGKRSVLLIEADLHNPTLARSLGMQARPGLAECLEGGLEPVTAIRRLEPLGWYALQAGEPQVNPTELLQSDSVTALMEKLSPYFDWILIDTPPIVPLSDALSLSQQTDATLLVVRADRTPSDAVKEALARLGPKRVLGIVLNGAKGLNRLGSEYSQYYGRK